MQTVTDVPESLSAQEPLVPKLWRLEDDQDSDDREGEDPGDLDSEKDREA